MVRILIALAVIARIAAASERNISGMVIDPSGGLIPAAEVTARSSVNGAVRHAASNRDGAFVVPDLPPGTYTLEVDHPGFLPYRYNGLELVSDSTVRVEIVLTLGSHSDALTVTETVSQVETAATQFGERLSFTKMATLPVNGRSFTDLLALQPGVVPASSRQLNAVVMSGCTTAPPSGDLNPGNVSVSGQRETTNGFSINGTSAQDDFNMGAAIVPNLDSIQEFRVLTANFNAEYGNFSGSQVQVTTKSGADQFHGAAFAFLRDTPLDARNYFAADRAQYDRPAIRRRRRRPAPQESDLLFHRLSRHPYHSGRRNRLDLGTLLPQSNR